MQTCIWPSWCHCHSLSVASVESRLVLPFCRFWYRLTRVVPDRGPLNWCVCVRVCVFFWSILIFGTHIFHKVMYRHSYGVMLWFKCEFVANLPLSLSVKEFWKWVNMLWSYGQEFRCRSDLSIGPFCVTRPNSTHQLTDPTQPTTSGKIWTQPNTTNNGAYSLVVTNYYTQNSSCTSSQPSILPHVLYCHYTY